MQGARFGLKFVSGQVTWEKGEGQNENASPLLLFRVLLGLSKVEAWGS